MDEPRTNRYVIGRLIPAYAFGLAATLLGSLNIVRATRESGPAGKSHLASGILLALFGVVWTAIFVVYTVRFFRLR